MVKGFPVTGFQHDIQIDSHFRPVAKDVFLPVLLPESQKFG